MVLDGFGTNAWRWIWVPFVFLKTFELLATEPVSQPLRSAPLHTWPISILFQKLQGHGHPSLCAAVLANGPFHSLHLQLNLGQSIQVAFLADCRNRHDHKKHCAEDIEKWDPPRETHHKGGYLPKLSNTFMAFTKVKISCNLQIGISMYK